MLGMDEHALATVGLIFVALLCIVFFVVSIGCAGAAIYDKIQRNRKKKNFEEVVHCCQCKYLEQPTSPDVVFPTCVYHDKEISWSKNDYCSWGERKDAEQTS